MPAGVTWGRYLKYVTVSMLTMFAGAQTVHVFYKPLEDMDEWVEKEKQKLKDSSQTSTHNSS